MELHEIRNKLNRLRLVKVAEATGLKYMIIHGIASGRRQRPSYEEVQKIVKYLEEIGV